MSKVWWKKEIDSSTYIGWRGLGPILGTRYYLNLGENVIKFISRSPYGGIEIQVFSASAVLCTDAKRPSMAYSIFGAMIGFLGDLFHPLTMKDNIEVVNSDGVIGLLSILLSSFFIAVVVGTIADRLFERPRINIILEGGTSIGTFTNFKKRMPETIRAISSARGISSSESMRSNHRYYTFMGRAM